MTPSQFERLEQVLQALEPEIKNMTGSSPQFVRDQIERVEQYGVNVRVSPKQAEWLENLYSKHCGVTMRIMSDDTAIERSEVMDEEDAGSRLRDNDMDDEIPF